MNLSSLHLISVPPPFIQIMPVIKTFGLLGFSTEIRITPLGASRRLWGCFLDVAVFRGEVLLICDAHTLLNARLVSHRASVFRVGQCGASEVTFRGSFCLHLVQLSEHSVHDFSSHAATPIEKIPYVTWQWVGCRGAVVASAGPLPLPVPESKASQIRRVSSTSC